MDDRRRTKDDGVMIKAHIAKDIIKLYDHNTYIFTVVKELRSKMFGQHPGYFKAKNKCYLDKK
jgi:hypothetical protein